MKLIHLATLSLLVTGLASAQQADKKDQVKKVSKPVQVKPATTVPQGKGPQGKSELGKTKQGKDAKGKDAQSKVADEAPPKLDPSAQLRVALKSATEETKYLEQVREKGGLLSRFKRSRAIAQELVATFTPTLEGPMPAAKKFVARLMGDAEKRTMSKDVVFLVSKFAVRESEFNAMVKYLESYPRPKSTEDVKSQAIAALVRAHAAEGTHTVAASKARAAIEEIAVKIANGESFGELAKTNSDDLETRAQGGKRGFLVRKDMDKTYAQAAFGLRVGEVSKIVHTAQGYHLIRLLAKKSGETPDQDKVRTSHILKQATPNDKDQKALLELLGRGTIDVAFRDDDLRKLCPSSFK